MYYSSLIFYPFIVRQGLLPPPLESTPNENTASLETAGQDERSTVSTATLCDMGGGSEGDWGYIILFPQPLKL